MPVIEVYEDIFDSSMQTLVNPINTVGRMGKGLALEFRNRVPGLYDAYRSLCARDMIKYNSLWRYKWPGTQKQVVCLPTKIHYSMDSSKEMVIHNLHKLAMVYERLGILSLAIPPVGCGLGGLSYPDDIRDAMFEAFEPLGIEVQIVLGKK